MRNSNRPGPIAWFTIVAMMAVPLLLPVMPTAEAATTREVVITTSSAKPAVSFAGFDGNPAKVFDINGDGKLEIIAQNDNQYVYVFDSKTGALLFQAKTKFPTNWGARSFNGPEVSIMHEGGEVRLVVANSAAYITSYKFVPGTSSSTKFTFVKEWERRLDDCHANPGMDSKPVLADLDKDGRMEILAGTEESGVYALRDSGTLFWKNCTGGGNAEPTVGDLNQDGFLDVVHVSDGGLVSALNGRTGNWMWSFNVKSKFNLGSGSIPVGAAVAQLNGVGGPDVVFGARDSHDATNWGNDHAVLVALDHAGKFLWGKQDPTGNPLTYTHPIIVDADKDGKPEVYWGDWNTIGHKPPFDESQAWKTTGPAHFYRFDQFGNQVWRQSLDTWWSNKDLALADVDADGVQEVLANGPNAGHDGIWYLNSKTGAKETFIDTHPHQVSRGPVVADLWNTGTMQWVVEAGSAILVYDTHVAYNSAWPHLPYTSFPRPSTPPPPTTTPPPPTTPPPTGTFDATFTIKAPNAWWQEVFVEPDTPRTLTSVQVRANDGPWQAMTLRSWGAWTSSFNTPAGTQVEFFARDSGNSVSQSEPFTWMDGTLTKRSVSEAPPPTTPPPTTTTPPPTTTTPPPTTPPPTTTTAPPTTTTPPPTTPPPTTTTPPPTTTTPPPTTMPPPSNFTANFSVPPGVNAWWVEVNVTSNQTIAAVDARVNGGGWTALEKKTWGHWAKSFFVAEGSNVQFRATDTTGQQALSGDFVWLSDVFTATFQPCCTDNNWWVEVRITSSDPIVKVEASVNGGSWTALSKTTWGTWAKGFFVPDGAQVRFRATNEQAETVTSAAYTWT